MKRYRVLIEFAGEEVGNILSSAENDTAQNYGDIVYTRASRSGKTIWQERMLPHEIILMIKAGILEEVQE